MPFCLTPAVTRSCSTPKATGPSPAMHGQPVWNPRQAVYCFALWPHTDCSGCPSCGPRQAEPSTRRTRQQSAGWHDEAIPCVSAQSDQIQEPVPELPEVETVRRGLEQQTLGMTWPLLRCALRAPSPTRTLPSCSVRRCRAAAWSIGNGAASTCWRPWPTAPESAPGPGGCTCA